MDEVILRYLTFWRRWGL